MKATHRDDYFSVIGKPAWKTSDVEGYQIELDLSNPYQPYQRHIWFHKDGTIFVEDWIPSTKKSKLGANWHKLREYN